VEDDRPFTAAIAYDAPVMSNGSSPALAQYGSRLRVQEPGARGDRARLDEPPRRSWIVHVAVLAICAMLFGAGLFSGGFVIFANQVSGMKPVRLADADGIVVFTGGAERVSGALDLLSGGHARRLLISGVHPDTSARQISRAVNAGPSLFECCVDLDRRAANTLGNASETAKWVRRNAFSSLIVVTSAYHMPRSLAELGSAMPDVRLVPYPVTPPSLALDRWYLSRYTAVLLLQEYLKYMASKARLSLDSTGMAEPILAGVAR
jgi:uncharacterized SAM-binding protein YcdF (DUF218 family)